MRRGRGIVAGLALVGVVAAGAVIWQNQARRRRRPSFPR